MSFLQYSFHINTIPVRNGDGGGGGEWGVGCGCGVSGVGVWVGGWVGGVGGGGGGNKEQSCGCDCPAIFWAHSDDQAINFSRSTRSGQTRENKKKSLFNHFFKIDNHII